MKLLLIGDIIGRPGRDAIAAWLPDFRRDHGIAFVIANGENTASGFGITRPILHGLFASQVDCVTSGNHIWAQKEVEGWIGNEVRLLRPANFPPAVPGHGTGVYETRNGVRVAVANLCGRVFMQPLDCPFAWADRELEALRSEARIVVVDFHAEATSEKQAFARYVDGRVTAVVGTHTHVQTADERLLPGGTAYITDCGMTGPVDSIIGTEIEPVLTRYRTQMPRKFTVGPGPVDICGAIIDIDEETGRATRIERVRERFEQADDELEQ
ncbi:MAG: TIGR00282 family metallophosphoesterase [Armatimonadetes bacterium]|nr:TIGR00282 family metallophosphoesterase [Armatimonadota bacterium]